MTPGDHRQLEAALERAECELRLPTFLQRAWRHMDPAAFIPGWSIDAVCEHLEAVTRGEIRKLIISIPPRHMKSLTTAVVWPAWTWAQRKIGPLSGPQVNFLFSSYAASLSTRDSAKCRRVIESGWYQALWGDRFQLAGDENLKTRFTNSAHGSRLATSVGGALTGEGGDIIVVDDAMNAIAADSPEVRASTLTFWSESLSTRHNNPRTGAFVLIGQRLHENDLTGYVLAREHGWTHLCLPARFEPDHPYAYAKDPRSAPGEPLWPDRFGDAELSALEASMGSYAAAGQLQQRPSPRDGGLFKRRWFEIVDAVPAAVERVRKWDLAATAPSAGRDPDWTVGVLLARDSAGFYYVEHVERLRASAHEVEQAIRATAARDGKQVAIGLNQDPGQAGKAQVGYLTRALAGFNVSSAPETGSKLIRAQPFAAQCEAGNVKLVRGLWNEAFLREVETFPAGAHDDQVDAAAGAFGLLASPSLASWGLLELERRFLAENGRKPAEPEPVQYAPGSMEWLAAQPEAGHG